MRRFQSTADCVAALRRGGYRARPHCRFVLTLIHCIPDSLTYSVPLFLKRQCDRTLGGRCGGDGVACRGGGRAVLHRRPESRPGRHFHWLGQLQPFPSRIPTGMRGPTCIFWANLTPFSPQSCGQAGLAEGDAVILTENDSSDSKISVQIPKE